VTSTLAAIAPPLGFRLVRVEELSGLTAEAVPYPRDTWMVVASFGGFDEDAVESGVRLGLPYVGLVSSARRAERVIDELKERGLKSEDLSVVRSPAGLPVGAGGQEGISLSIMAEIFSLRAKLQPPAMEEQPAAATDPVCGMQVEIPTAQYTSEYGGETYYFCGPGCKSTFERTPRKYATNAVSTG
jgi:xanthine dehydrogenase accessory factor